MITPVYDPTLDPAKRLKISADALAATASTGWTNSPTIAVYDAAPMIVPTAVAPRINFDSIDAPTEGMIMPSGYGGLTWSSNWAVLDAVDYGNAHGPNGYTNGLTSGRNVAYNGSAANVEFSSLTDFDLASVNLTAAWRNGLKVEIHAYDDGVEQYSRIVTVDWNADVKVLFNWASIDRVTFSSYGGTEDSGNDGSGAHFAADDFVFLIDNTPGSIRGRLYNDKDGDGRRESGEGALAGWTVFIDANDNGRLDTGERSTVTTSTGTYVFNNVAAGDYVIGEVVKPGWEMTGREDFPTVTVNPGQTVNNVDFGNVDVSDSYGRITGIAFHDVDADGVRDAGETGLANWQIYLDLNRNGHHDTGELMVTTDASGRYDLGLVAPGTYHVMQQIPAGTWENWRQTSPAPQEESAVAAQAAEHSAAAAPSTGRPAPDFGAAHAEGEVIVKLSAGLSAQAISATMQAMGAEVVSSTKELGIQLWKLNGMSVEQAITKFGNSAGIEYMEPNYTVTAQVLETKEIPTDPDFDDLWGLHNTGQDGGTADADIDAPEAWEITTGGPVVVGIIDTGIDYTHPDLDANIWTNAGEIAGNGIDDDDNGYVDDVHGYDFVNDDGNPMDDNEHGTHVAGTIAAEANNGIGVTGINWNAQVMALKFLNSAGSGSIFDAVRAVEYATMMGVKITNNSWGGGGYSQSLYDAIEAAGAAGSIFIAAAGNDGSDNDLFENYPSNYDLDNIVAVASTDRNDELSWFSNWGETMVDLGAPGEEILSTVPGGGYESFSGTSMATPHVAGAASLLLSLDPTLTVAEIKQILMDSADPIEALEDITVTGGRLNLLAALEMVGGGGGSQPPNIVTVVAGGNVTNVNFGTAGGATNRNDTIAGTTNGDLIDALAGNDTVTGGDGNDTIFGNGGNDTLDGGAGADSLNGGGELDSVTYALATQGVAVSLQAGRGYGGEANGDRLADIGSIIGSAYDDMLTGSDAANTLEGGKGEDYLVGLDGNDTLKGGDNNDILRGGTENDQLDGGAGDDTLNGDAGADQMAGGTANDRYVVDNADDRVTELPGGGTDSVLTTITYILPNQVEVLLFGGIESINGTGNALDNRIAGNAGNNKLYGLDGDDNIAAGGGADSLFGGRFNDTLTGGNGNDTFCFDIAGSAHADEITDYSVPQDAIQLDNAFFSNLAEGTLAAAAFVTGARAADASDRIIYNRTTGDLFYDRDGTGAAVQSLIATLDAGLIMTASEFAVI